jgi:hypothetical protein
LPTVGQTLGLQMELALVFGSRTRIQAVLLAITALGGLCRLTRDLCARGASVKVLPNRRCSWRRSCGMRAGTRFARVRRAVLLVPPQLNALRWRLPPNFNATFCCASVPGSDTSSQWCARSRSRGYKRVLCIRPAVFHMVRNEARRAGGRLNPDFAPAAHDCECVATPQFQNIRRSTGSLCHRLLHHSALDAQ